MKSTAKKPSPRVWLAVRFRQWRTDARAWLSERGLELWLVVGLWSLLSLLIFWLATGHESPRRYQDEYLFWAIADSFANGDGLTWRGQGLGMFYFLYPVLLAPAFWIGKTVAASYTIVHLINSLMIVGVIFPAYLLARLFLDRWRSLLAGLFAVSVPALNYAGIIGTENLAYPIAVAAFGAMVLSIAQPRRRNWFGALFAVGLAVLTRAQFAVMLPIYFAAVLLAGQMLAPRARRSYYRVQREPLLVMVSGFVLVGLLFVTYGTRTAGLYAGAFSGISPPMSEVWYWLKALMADVYVIAAVIPVIATFAMFFERGNRRNPLVGALLAVTLVATIAFVAQVTWFSAVNPYNWRERHIFYERYMFYIAPLFFTGLLVAWRRVTLRGALLSSLIAVVIMSGFQTDSVLVPFSYDSFGLTIVGWYMESHPASVPHIGMLLAGVTAVLAAIYCLSRLERSTIARLLSILAVALPLGILVIGQAQTWNLALLYSHDAFATEPKPANFITQSTDRDVAMLITSTDSPEMYFTTEFWNPNIVRAFTTDAEPIKSPIVYSPTCRFDWNRSGRIISDNCDKLPSSIYLRSDQLSMHLKDEIDRIHPTEQYPGMTLMIAEPPARILSFVNGRNVNNGQVNTTMTVRSFLDNPGELRVRFDPVKRQQIVHVGDKRALLPAGESKTLIVPLPTSDTTTTVRIEDPLGNPDVGIVGEISVRERGGNWRSIR